MARKQGKPVAAAPEVPMLRAVAMENHAQLYRHKAFPQVRQGTLYGFALAEALVPPAIGPGESAILTLAALGSGLAYGITGGDRGHAFYFHPAYGVTHLGLVGAGPVSAAAVVDAGGEEVVGGWREAAGGGLFRHACAIEAGQGLEQFRGAVTPLLPLAPLPAGEGVVALVSERATRTVFGVTLPDGLLFRLDADQAEIRVLARIEGAAPVLVRLPDGRLLGAFAEGQLWQFEPESGALTALTAQAPCQMGKRYVAGVQSLLLSRSGLVYGGTSTDGYLFSYDPAAAATDLGGLVNLGKPVRQSNIRALAEGHDGRLFGIAEEQGGLAHFFVFDPLRRSFDDLGLVGAAFPEHWLAHSVGCLSVGPFGEIFLGESDRISHVFIYYPPVLRPGSV
jgi:hypothetical protein